MSQSVRYHRGPHNEFSLSYVSPDRESLFDHLEQYTPPTRVLTATVPLSTPVHLVYAYTPSGESEGDLQIPEHPFVKTLLCVFAGIVDGREQQGDTVRGNKSASLREIPDILSSRIDWKRSVPAVGGQLLSNLILAHTLPNANHRTSLGMLLVYLQSVGAEVTPDDILEGGAEKYIVDSKRLLTVRRNATKFRILKQCGCTTVERKGGIRIPLEEFDLSCKNPYEDFARAHERRSIRFVEQLLDDEWQDVDDPGLSVFVSRLEEP